MRVNPLTPRPARRRRRRSARSGHPVLAAVALALALAGAYTLVAGGAGWATFLAGARRLASTLPPFAAAPAPARRSPPPAAATPPVAPSPASAAAGTPAPPPLAGAGPGRISRAQLALLLAADFGLSPTDVGPRFVDVPPGAPGRPEIEAAAGAGDFGDDPGPRFGPSAPVTRLELAQTLIDALGLGPVARLVGATPPPVADAGSLPPSAWGSVRLAVQLGLIGASGAAFRPAAAASAREAALALARARALPAAALDRALAPAVTSVTATVSPTALEPGQSATLSAAVHAGELTLPLAVRWQATGGHVVGGAFLPTITSGDATLVASVPGARARAYVHVAVQTPTRIVALWPPPIVLPDRTVTLRFAVVDATGAVVAADDGRTVAIRWTAPAGAVSTVHAVDRGGVVSFSFLPQALGTYRVVASAPGLGGADAPIRVVPASVGSLSLLTSATALGAGDRVALDAVVVGAPGGASGRLPAGVPVTLTATFRPSVGAPVPLGTWRAVVPTFEPMHPTPLAEVGPLTGPGTVVVDLSTAGGAFVPARAVLAVAGRGSLRIAPPPPAVAGRAALITVEAPAAANGSALSLALTAPDGGPLAPVSQVVDHGRAQFLVTPLEAGRYALAVRASGLAPATGVLAVRPGPPARLTASLATPFPAPGAALRLRVAVTDPSGNPIADPHIAVAWRPAAATRGRWRQARLASGGWLDVGTAPAAGDCSVAVRLSAPALSSTTRVLACATIDVRTALAAGTGAFLSYWVARDASPQALVTAAVRAHLHTLYVEVAVPGSGFWGQPGLDRLLPVAHQAGLAVVAWVPANLRQPGRDLAVARAALAYRTSLGQAVDGVAADFEGDLSPSVLIPYLKAVRAAAGPTRVVCAIARAPADLSVPYALMARYADVLMPMTYWENTETPVAYQGAYRLVAASVELVRSLAPTAAVVPVLQAYDPFTAGGTGVYNPTPLAERGALAGARAAGAYGAAFFQWGTITPAEWRIVAQAGAHSFASTP